MSTPYQTNGLEDQLACLRAMLTVVDHVFDHLVTEGDDHLRDGAELCLRQALDIVTRLQTQLPARVLNSRLREGGGR